MCIPLGVLGLTHLATDMDKLISVKGLVIRATPIIPDMKEGIVNYSVYL